MGSPNRNGSTSILAENFKKGAEESGHNVEVIDVCRADVRPCTGCVACGYEGVNAFSMTTTSISARRCLAVIWWCSQLRFITTE